MNADIYSQACEHFRTFYHYILLNVDHRNRSWTKKLEVCRSQDQATDYFRDLLIGCKIESFSVQRNIADKIIELFDSHYWQYLKKSGSLDRRKRMYDQWRQTTELLQELASDPNDWIGKSADIRKLIAWLKGELPGIDKEEAELLSNYSGSQPHSDYTLIVGEIIHILKENSKSLEMEEIIVCVDAVLAKIYPVGLRWSDSNYPNRSDALKTAYQKYLVSMKQE